MIACNFEIIQSPCQDFGNVLKRSMAFLSQYIKVTKMRGLLFWKHTQSKVLMLRLYTIEKRSAYRGVQAGKVDLEIVFVLHTFYMALLLVGI